MNSETILDIAACLWLLWAAILVFNAARKGISEARMSIRQPSPDTSRHLSFDLEEPAASLVASGRLSMLTVILYDHERDNLALLFPVHAPEDESIAMLRRCGFWPPGEVQMIGRDGTARTIPELE